MSRVLIQGFCQVSLAFLINGKSGIVMRSTLGAGHAANAYIRRHALIADDVPRRWRTEMVNSQDQPEVYEIVVYGHLDQDWSDWLEGLTVFQKNNGETLLTGPIIDQAALHGILNKIQDLGLPLISVTRTQPE